MKSKKIIIVALAGMVFPLMAVAQAGAGYVPVVREGIEWGYVDDYFAFDLGGYNFFRLQFKGDTIVDGVDYKKLYAYSAPELDVKKATLYALMREEDKKVYSRMMTGMDADGDERMLYDFNNATEGGVMNIYDSGHAVPLPFRGSTDVDGRGCSVFYDRETQDESMFVVVEGVGLARSVFSGTFAYPFIPQIAAPGVGGGGGVGVSGYSESRLMYQREAATGRVLYRTADYDRYIKGDCSAPEYAYQYRPTVKEGVEWGYVMGYNDGSPMTYYRLQMRGTHEVNGKQYHCVYRYETPTLEEAGAIEPYALMREEGRRVYTIMPSRESVTASGLIPSHISEGEEVMVYDFNYEDGEPMALLADGVTIDYAYSTCYFGDDGEMGPAYALAKEGDSNRYYIVGEEFGVVHGSGVGSLPYPYAAKGDNTKFNHLLYLRDLKGNILRKNTYFDTYKDGDPTLAAVSTIKSDNGLDALIKSIDGLSVTVTDGEAMVDAYSVDGKKVDSGKSVITHPSPGIYILRRGSTSCKVAVK